jgi:putative SOS response-associated peptidase YedK
MCGRYAFAVKDTGRFSRVLTGVCEEFDDKYNISPASMVPVYLQDSWKVMRWGLIPSWSKEQKLKYATFNARSDSLVNKPAFRSAWKHGQRCLIPATGYFEWKNEGTLKTPYFIRSIHNDEPLVFAGLWDWWHDEASEIYSCTIITRDADNSLREIHDRMPLMLEPDLADLWLHGDPGAALEILGDETVPELIFYRVSELVGNPRNQGADLIRNLGQRNVKHD